MNMLDSLKDSPAKYQAWLAVQIERAIHMAPSIVILDHLDVISKKTSQQDFSQLTNRSEEILASAGAQIEAENAKVMLIATARDLDRVDDGILDKFPHKIGIQSPTEEERLEMLLNLTDGLNMAAEISLRDLSLQTASFVAQDLAVLIALACELVLSRAKIRLYVSLTRLVRLRSHSDDQERLFGAGNC